MELARQAVRRGRPKQSLEDVIDTVVEEAEEGGEGLVDHAIEAESEPVEIVSEKQLVPYQDGMPFDLERIKQRILNCGMNILEESVTIGKYLIWAKEELGRGEFEKWLKDDVDMSSQRASECMRIAQRMIESKSPLERGFLQIASSGSKKKFLSLLDVTDEEIQEVMETETFLGKPLDEVGAMSVRQLRDVLREEKERNSVLRDKIEAKERKLSRVQADLDRAKNPDEVGAEAPPTILERRLLALIKRFGEVERVAIEFAEEFGDEGLLEPDIRDMAGSVLGTLNQKCTALYQILVPDQVRDQRLHIPLQAKSGEDVA